MNAAELYREAFALLPEREWDVYAHLVGRDDPEADRLVEQGAAALDLLHRAGQCPDCDWGPEAALGSPVEDFAGARRLAVLALLRAGQAFRRGDDLAGLDDLIALMALGRHLGRGKYLSGLAGFPIEDLAVTEAIALVDRLDRDACRTLAARLDSLPPFPDLASAVRAEQAYFRAHYRDRFAALSGSDVEGPIRAEFGLHPATELDRFLDDLVFPEGDPAERMLQASGGSKESLIALADEVLAAFETLAAVAGGASDAAETLAALRAAGALNPLLARELDTFDRMRPIWERYALRFGRLRAVALAGEPDGCAERIPHPD